MLDKMFGASVKHGVLGTNKKRTYDYVLKKCMEELGELSVEIQIDEGLSYKEAGKDGIKGEAVDLAIAAMDVFALACGDMEKKDIEKLFVQTMNNKIEKWHKTSGVTSDKYSEVLESGVHHSFNCVDTSYATHSAVWVHPKSNFLDEYIEDSGCGIESYTLEDYIGGNRDVFVYVAEYDFAVETFKVWEDVFNKNITKSNFSDVNEPFFMFLVKQGNFGVIFSQQNPKKLIGSTRVYHFQRGVGLSSILISHIAQDQKLRGIKQWDDYQDDFYENVLDKPNIWITDVINAGCTPDFKPSTEELYTICLAVNNMPHFEVFEDGEMFVEIVDRLNYINKTKNGERGYYYEINMECEVGNAYKQYNLEILNGNTVLTSYGKIEADVLTSQKRSFGTDKEAQQYINTKTAEKMREGYTIVGTREVK